MLCIHDVDFDELGGFNKSIVNWGGEDVDLYERTVKHPNLEVRSLYLTVAPLVRFKVIFTVPIPVCDKPSIDTASDYDRELDLDS